MLDFDIEVFGAEKVIFSDGGDRCAFAFGAIFLFSLSEL